MTFTADSIKALVNTAANLYDALCESLSEEYASDIVSDNICLTAQQARGFGLDDIADSLENAEREGD